MRKDSLFADTFLLLFADCSAEAKFALCHMQLLELLICQIHISSKPALLVELQQET